MVDFLNHGDEQENEIDEIMAEVKKGVGYLRDKHATLCLKAIKTRKNCVQKNVGLLMRQSSQMVDKSIEAMLKDKIPANEINIAIDLFKIGFGSVMYSALQTYKEQKGEKSIG